MVDCRAETQYFSALTQMNLSVFVCVNVHVWIFYLIWIHRGWWNRGNVACTVIIIIIKCKQTRTPLYLFRYIFFFNSAASCVPNPWEGISKLTLMLCCCLNVASTTMYKYGYIGVFWRKFFFSEWKWVFLL